MTSRFAVYGEDFIELCFRAWYSAGRPAHYRRMDWPKDDHGRAPSAVTVRRWRIERGWEERADILDAKAIELADTTLVQQKADMLRKQAQIGFELQELGMASLKADGFDSSSSAVSAVVRGAELERTSRGIGELLVKMAAMTDEELEAEILKQLTRASEAGQILDADEVEDEESASTE